MTVIRVWALESDYDRDAINKLSKKLINYFGKSIEVRASGKATFNSILRKRKKDDLKIAVESYLLNGEDKVIFIIDSDSESSLSDRRKEPNSLISRIEKISKSNKFNNNVFLAMAVQELEAWLLTDCNGIFCYFVKNTYNLDLCRQKISSNKKFIALIKKYQKGDTELIVESTRGGKGAKEYLIKFSKEILKTLKPNMKNKNIDKNIYREFLSSEIVDYIEITNETINRNKSLKYFRNLLIS